jgi:tRNA-uridine 2-sulfurtransferase
LKHLAVISRHAKVAVALSGGVDSAVAAAILRRQGYEVFGVHLWLAEAPPPEEHLRKLSHSLDLPFTILDLRPEFGEKVVRYFLRAYARGLTPNPCIRCNALIKFGVLWEKVQALGAERLATGHYVRLLTQDGEPGLSRGVDRSKDQSYFLCQLPRSVLPHLLFPLGELTKIEVRRRARELRLPLMENCRESQEICFIKDESYLDFMQSRRCLGPPGDVVDRQGRRLGRHRGLACYTVGQRRGCPARNLTMSWTSSPKPTAWWWGSKKNCFPPVSGLPRSIGSLTLPSRSWRPSR